jgi:hypothetical protein
VPRRDGQVFGLVEIVALLGMILALLAVVLTLAGLLDDALEVVKTRFVR